MSSTAHVVMCAVPGGVRDEAWAALSRDWPLAVIREHDAADAYSYGKLLRLLWREPGDLVVVEQDVVVPAGSVRRLLDCECTWCTHPHWVGSHYRVDTLGLVRFSAALRASYPDLVDHALGSVRNATRQWVLRFGDPDPWGGPPASWPTTVRHDQGTDTRIVRELQVRRVTQCVHRPPTIHLRPYSATPDSRGVTGSPDPRLESLGGG